MMKRLLLQLIILCLSGQFVAQGASLKADIDSVSGRVEIMRQNSLKWEMLGDEEAVSHNDKINVHKGGYLRLKFPDRSEIIVREKTKFLFNSSPVTKAGNANKVITVYYGEIYAAIKKPIEHYEGHVAKIFCPTMSTEAASGSILVEVDSATRHSRIYITRGTFRARGMRDQQTYVKEGYTVATDTGGNFTPEEEVHEEKFFFTKSWLPKEFLDRELGQGRLTRKRKLDVIAGKSTGRLVVVPFGSEVKERFGDWDLSEFFTYIAVDVFGDFSYRELVLIRDTAMSAEEINLQYSADRILFGNVKKFAIQKTAVLKEDSSKYELRLKVHFALEVRIVDPIQDKVIKKTVFKAEALEVPGENNDLELLLSEPLSSASPRINKSVVGNIIRSLRKNMVKFGRSAL